MEHLDRCDLCGSREIRVLDRAAGVDECTRCGFIFHNPRPTREEIARYYSTPGKYDEWLAELSGRDLLWKRRLRIVRRFVRRGKLLDVGAGIGQFLFHAKAHFEVKGTEISEEAVRIARERFGVELSHGALEESDLFEPGSFDVITLIHVLEHVPSPSRTLGTCRRLLAPGGHLVIAVPNGEHSFSRHGGLTKYGVKKVLSSLGVEKHGNLPRFEKIVLDPGVQTEIHLSHFTRTCLASFLERNGFEVSLNSLDPYYSSTGFYRFRENMRFGLFKLLLCLSSRNLYDTILIVAKKRVSPSPSMGII
jgi:ubiquinone/menaquinone biosynthesis C-methylase UbiE